MFYVFCKLWKYKEIQSRPACRRKYLEKMDKAYIKERFHNLKTPIDLLNLLNDIKADNLGEDAYPFSLKQLFIFSNPNKTVRRYRHFSIPKKSGGVREIAAPIKGLKSMQIYLNEILQAVYEPLPCVMGFALNRSVVQNAQLHIGQRYILNIDLKDFFPSIEEPRIAKRLQVAPYNLPKNIARIVAGLSCMRIDDEENEKRTISNFLLKLFSKTKKKYKYGYILPQGAPTSPILTNMICERLDWQLTGLAKRFGIRYSRYADDITFSGMNYIFSEKGKFWKELRRIINNQNFTINEKKTRLLRKGQQQEVTGLIVSQNKVNVSKKWIKDLRAILHIWERYGYSAASIRLLQKYSKPTTKNPHLENVIEGKLLYLKMVKGETDSVYTKLKAQFDKLRPFAPIPESNSLSFITSFTIDTFEKNLSTEINVNEKENGKLSASYKDIYGLNHNIVVSEEVLFENLNNLRNRLRISLVDNGENRFYMLHFAKSGNTIDNEQTQLELCVAELNIELDNILNSLNNDD